MTTTVSPHSTDRDTHRSFMDGLPDELLQLDDHELLRALGKPTLVRFPGAGDLPPRAVACLLHGDESTGYHAALRVLRRRTAYPFDLFLVIGNVRAALAERGYAHRFLDDQEDFNRVWGIDQVDTPMRRAAAEMLEILREAGLESLVDVHNNSGDNPFYAIVTTERAETLNLATIFTTTILHWGLREHTLMEALDEDCAAIAVECGLPGQPESLAFAVDGLRRYLGEGPLERERYQRDYDLLHGLRKVRVRDDVRFGFGGELGDGIDFVIAEDADVHNFVEVPSGHVVGHVHAGAPMPLVTRDAAGRDVTADHFTVVDGVVMTVQPATPVMMTRTVEAARKDCLFYLTTERPPSPTPGRR